MLTSENLAAYSFKLESRIEHEGGVTVVDTINWIGPVIKLFFCLSSAPRTTPEELFRSIGFVLVDAPTQSQVAVNKKADKRPRIWQEDRTKLYNTQAVVTLAQAAFWQHPTSCFKFHQCVARSLVMLRLPSAGRTKVRGRLKRQQRLSLLLGRRDMDQAAFGQTSRIQSQQLQVVDVFRPSLSRLVLFRDPSLVQELLRRLRQGLYAPKMAARRGS